MRAFCCLPSVDEVGRKILFRPGLSKLCFDSSLRPLRARGLLVASGMYDFRWVCSDEFFCLVLNYYLFGFAAVHSYLMGTGGSSPGVKRPKREADHSPPTSAEVKKTWIYTSTPPYVFMAYCLIS
jgi:hypothetical protein